MICPRCGKEYGEYRTKLSLFISCTFHFWCDDCDTTLYVEVPWLRQLTQAMINKAWHDMDMGGLHPEAKVI